MPRRLVISGAIAIIALHLCDAATLGAKPPGPLIAELLGAMAAALAAWMCLGAARRASGVSRHFWLLFALALASQCVTDLAWTYYEGVLHLLPMTITAVRVLPLVRTVLVAMVLFLDPEEDSSRLGFGSLVDFVQISIVFFFVYLLIEYIPEHSPGSQNYFLRGVWIGEAERIVLLALAIAQLLRARKRQIRLLYRNLFFYLWWYLFAEGVANYVMITRGIPSGTPLDLTWMLPSLAVALWADSWKPAGQPQPEVAPRPKTVSELMLTNATFALAPLIVLLQVTQLGPEWQLLRYSLLSASILCFAARLGLSEYRQFQHLESLGQQKVAIESAKEALAVQKAFLDQLIESAPEAIAIIYSNGAVQRINREFTRLFGYTAEDIIGLDLDELIVPKDRKNEGVRLNQEAHRGNTASLETTRQSKDGTQIDVSVLISPVNLPAGPTSLYCIYRDIREAKRVENQLRQAQKMEAVGRLAGGVAHDFNNLLTVINGYGDLLLQRFRQGDPARAPVEQIRSAGERAAQLTQQLLVVSRRQIVQLQPLDLNELVRDSEMMLGRLIGENIKLTSILCPSLRQIMADAGQVHQVLMNLVVNARDAMPEGGRLIIETSNADVNAADILEDSNAVPGPYTLLSVRDTGIGIDAETLQHIFEPFFTTKEAGKGTGLGLSTVYGIVRQSGGFTRVESEPGQGTTFRLYLPATDIAVPGGAGSEAVVPYQRGSETILVAEDQEDVRHLVMETLQSYGYSVLGVVDGAEALQIAEQRVEPIHLVLTDVVMPGLNGKVLAERLKLLRPETKVLFMSGYTDDAIGHYGVLDAQVAYIAKPFSPESLVARVREVLLAPARPTVLVAEDREIT